MGCTTHHLACRCREEEFNRLLTENAHLRYITGEIQKTLDHADVCRIDDRQWEKLKMNAQKFFPLPPKERQ